MTSIHNEDIIKNVIKNTTVPLVLRQFVDDWPIRHWNLEKWSSVFEDKAVPFRCMNRNYVFPEPCWKRLCTEKLMTFDEFIGTAETSEEWMYFDYKRILQWFNGYIDLFSFWFRCECLNIMCLQEVSWEKFGHPERNASHSHLWVGSKGAHTPAHQDTYGYNIVTQLYGRKRWILFPPETSNMHPTRVPYEESSVYSKLNFYCPTYLDDFNDLTGARMVELTAGDALVVPRGWWHYVENIDNINISLNIWLPNDDTRPQVSETLIKIFVAQVCKDLPEETAKLFVNPNEDNLLDTPLEVLFEQLNSGVKKYFSQQTTSEVHSAAVTQEEEIDLNALLENKENKLELAASISTKDLIDLLKGKSHINHICNHDIEPEKFNDAKMKLLLTRAVIDLFCRSNVIDLVKQNLFEHVSFAHFRK